MMDISPLIAMILLSQVGRFSPRVCAERASSRAGRPLGLPRGAAATVAVIAERKIQEWIDDGGAERLTNKGQPLDRARTRSSRSSCAWPSTSSSDADAAPPWIEIGRELEALQTRAREEGLRFRDAQRRDRIVAALGGRPSWRPGPGAHGRAGAALRRGAPRPPALHQPADRPLQRLLPGRRDGARPAERRAGAVRPCSRRRPPSSAAGVALRSGTSRITTQPRALEPVDLDAVGQEVAGSRGNASRTRSTAAPVQ